MTPEQIKNWRTVLCGMLGPYALMMPDSQVIALKDKFQRDIDAIEVEEEFEFVEVEEVEVTNHTLEDLVKKFNKGV